MVRKRGVVLAAVLAAVVSGVAGPAQPAAAASNWSRTNGVAQASGTLNIRSGGFYDFAGTITVGQNDGQCYYMRFFRWGRLSDPGYGVNSPRQCGAGSLPIKVTVHSYMLIGVTFGLCKAAPDAPAESPFAGLGSHCSQT